MGNIGGEVIDRKREMPLITMALYLLPRVKAQDRTGAPPLEKKDSLTEVSGALKLPTKD